MPRDDNYYVQSFNRNEQYLSDLFLAKFNKENWKDLSFDRYDDQVVWEIISKMLEDDCNEGNINQVHVVPKFKNSTQYFGPMCCFVDSKFGDATFAADAGYDVKTYVPLGHLVDDKHINKFITSNSSADTLVDLLEHSPENLMVKKDDPKSIETVMKIYTQTKNHYENVRNFQNNFTWKNEGDGNLQFIQLQMKNIYIIELTNDAKDAIKQLSYDTEFKTFRNIQPFKDEHSNEAKDEIKETNNEDTEPFEDESIPYMYIIDAVIMATITIFYKLHHIYHHEFIMPPEFAKNEDDENGEPRKHISEELEDIPVAFKYMKCRVDTGDIVETVDSLKKRFLTNDDIEAFHNKNMGQFIFEDDQDPEEGMESEPETFITVIGPAAPPEYRRPVVIDLAEMGLDGVEGEIGDESEDVIGVIRLVVPDGVTESEEE